MLQMVRKSISAFGDIYWRTCIVFWTTYPPTNRMPTWKQKMDAIGHSSTASIWLLEVCVVNTVCMCGGVGDGGGGSTPGRHRVNGFSLFSSSQSIPVGSLVTVSGTGCTQQGARPKRSGWPLGQLWNLAAFSGSRSACRYWKLDSELKIKSAEQFKTKFTGFSFKLISFDLPEKGRPCWTERVWGGF